MEKYTFIRDNLWYLEIYRFNDIKKFATVMKNRIVIKKKKLLALERILKVIESKRQLTHEGIKLIEAVWHAPKTGANTR